MTALELLKRKIVNPPVLVMPRLDREKMVITDASGRWVGGVLLQQEGEEWRPCAFRSVRLKDEQKRYKVVELEAFAVVSAL